jgi:hypothetical protein
MLRGLVRVGLPRRQSWAYRARSASALGVVGGIAIVLRWLPHSVGVSWADVVGLARQIRRLASKKAAAGMGRPSVVRNVCSRSKPVIPTGMVARKINQASRSYGSAMRR